MKILPAMIAAVVAAGFIGAGVVRAAETPRISATLAEDLATLDVPLLPGYAQMKRPRLLFSAEDRAALQAKAKANPELWKLVLASSKRLGAVPPAEVIKTGSKYWRIEQVESGALAYFVTGDKAHLDAAVKWMVPHCQEAVWGTGFHSNLDLQASWYLYHLSVAYDILHDDIPEAERKVIRDGLAAHAKAIFESFDPNDHKEKYNFDQNHNYIPTVALAAASLSLLGEVPEAKDWLKRAYGVMNRSRYVLGDDGYYYEGYGYWSYAMHWHVRYADLIGRAKGKDFLDLPILKNNWKFALQLSLPGAPRAFDMHDTLQWAGDDRGVMTPRNTAIFWDLATDAAKRGDLPVAGDNKMVADMYAARAPDSDYPAAAFLWYAADGGGIKPTSVATIKPYHHFADADVVTWRSGWDEGATCMLFRCGPPEGHEAAEKIRQMKDWGMNAGHVHPDVGGFYLYAKGTYLAVSTGYTAEKWTKDHNTLLIDGKGQGSDGTYWNDKGISYDKLNEAKITRSFLSDDYAFASGSFGAIYVQTPGVNLQRSVLATKRYLLVIDDMSAAAEHKLTWMLHSDAEFSMAGKAFVSKGKKASLAVIPLAGDVEGTPAVTKVMAGNAPGKGTQTQRGYQLSLTMKNGAKAARLVNLLVPLGPGEAAPAVASSTVDGDSVALELKWADGKSESLKVDMKWKEGSGAGPAVIASK